MPFVLWNDESAVLSDEFKDDNKVDSNVENIGKLKRGELFKYRKNGVKKESESNLNEIVCVKSYG